MTVQVGRLDSQTFFSCLVWLFDVYRPAAIDQYYGADTEGSTTTGITIELGENNTVEIEAVVELLGCIYSILTRH